MNTLCGNQKLRENVARRPGLRPLGLALAYIGGQQRSFSVVKTVTQLRPLPYPPAEGSCNSRKTARRPRAPARLAFDFAECRLRRHLRGDGRLTTAAASSPARRRARPLAASQQRRPLPLSARAALGRTSPPRKPRASDAAAKETNRGRRARRSDVNQATAVAAALRRRLFDCRQGVTFDSGVDFGVMPEGFATRSIREHRVCRLRHLEPYAQHAALRFLEAVGRLKEGVSVEQGGADSRRRERLAPLTRIRPQPTRRTAFVQSDRRRPAPALSPEAAVGWCCNRVRERRQPALSARRLKPESRHPHGARPRRVSIARNCDGSVLLALAAGARRSSRVGRYSMGSRRQNCAIGTAGADARVIMFTLGVSCSGLVFGPRAPFPASRRPERAAQGGRAARGRATPPARRARRRRVRAIDHHARRPLAYD